VRYCLWVISLAALIKHRFMFDRHTDKQTDRHKAIVYTALA